MQDIKLCSKRREAQKKRYEAKASSTLGSRYVVNLPLHRPVVLHAVIDGTREDMHCRQLPYRGLLDGSKDETHLAIECNPSNNSDNC